MIRIATSLMRIFEPSITSIVINASEDAKDYEILDNSGVLHQFRYLNDISLNKSNPDVRVNFFEYMQISLG